MTVCAVTACACLAVGARGANVASEKQLREVQSRIERLSRQVAERTAERDALTAGLADIETGIAAAEQRRRELGGEQAAARARLAETEREIARQQTVLAAEHAELARQLRSAYTSGRQERIKLVLNQGSPAELGRMLVYYQYLNDARIDNMSAIEALLGNLASLREDALDTEARLVRLAEQTEALLRSLAADRDARQQLVVKIDRQLADDDALITELRAREQELSALIEELSSILADYPIDAEAPMSSLRGSLTWPVAGTLTSGFGAPRAGGKVRSKGVVLAADAGTDVRAIYHGRVAFADWLPGMGLLIIIDHGEGLMSLYGYNETLQKTVGDWISPGDVIATVGNTGGQSRAALYFELRNGKRAINPRPWFRQAPGAGRR